MPRGPMNPEHKRKLIEGRNRALRERSEAIDAVLGNSQFVSPKFWVAVMKKDEGLVEAIEKALKKAKKEKVKRELLEAEKKVEELRKQLES